MLKQDYDEQKFTQYQEEQVTHFNDALLDMLDSFGIDDTNTGGGLSKQELAAERIYNYVDEVIRDFLEGEE